MISVCAIAQEKKTYCEIVGDGNFKGDKVKVEIVFGDNVDNAIKSQTDQVKAAKFNSMVDALNFMAKQGWELEQTYAIPETSGMNRAVSSIMSLVSRFRNNSLQIRGFLLI